MAANNYRSASQLLTDKVVFSTEQGDELPVLIEKDCYDGRYIRDLIAEYIRDVKGGTINANELYYNTWKITGTNWNADKHDKVAALANADEIIIPKSADGRTDNVKSVTEEDLKAYYATKKTKISKIASKSNSMTVTIDKVIGADGYKVSYSTDKNFKKDVTTKTTTKAAINISNLKSNKKYYVKAVAYCVDNGAKVYSKTSSVKTVALAKKDLGKAKINKVSAIKKGMKINIAKVADATGYKVTYSTEKNLRRAQNQLLQRVLL